MSLNAALNSRFLRRRFENLNQHANSGIETHYGLPCYEVVFLVRPYCVGCSNREALGIGTLMNARGLMELIIINIGLQRGIISDGLFATLVIMAVVTTLMASPLFERLVGGGTQQPLPEPEAEEAGEPTLG
jgi:hypothetical protein